MYRTHALVRSSSYYGAGNSSQRILLDEVRCTGNETNIQYCRHNAIGSNDCSHGEDVGVLCMGSTTGETEFYWMIEDLPESDWGGGGGRGEGMYSAWDPPQVRLSFTG